MCTAEQFSSSDLFDHGRHFRGKAGFVLLASEQTIEDDMFRLFPDGVGLHFARVASTDDITVDQLSGLTDELTRAAATLLPDADLDVVSYACTSGSLVIGEDRVFSALRQGAPKATPTSLITAVINALRALRVRKVAVATPYLDEVNLREREYLEARGFEITRIAGLNLKLDSEMVKVRPDRIMELAMSVDTGDSEAVFISCGALRSIEIVEELEKKLGKPVICSNQAMAWDVLRILKIPDKINGFGALLRTL
ncbi:maleate cis-trans isomerase family protein [Roseibium sp. SCP14]|uniref:maleate cis-trans isomerase family protein n=1 Tax=Roseibium sp. SCP14 TaxID=3141375 RepID=UPI00333B7FF6